MALMLGVLSFTGVHVEHREPPPAHSTLTDSIYDSEFVGEIALRLDPDAWAALERKPRRFVWGELEHLGVIHRARVRLKGHRSMRELDEKPAFRLEFPDAPGSEGLRSLVLNNLVEDPTAQREVLAYGWLNELGILVPRTAYARVRLNDVDKGLYLLVEPLDDAFLAARSGAPSDLLYEGEYGCDIQSADVSGFDLDAGDDPKRERLATFSTIAAGETRRLFDPVSGPLDMHAFLRYLAASALIGDFDGYRHAHNYYAHYRAASDKWGFLPWGLDRAFTKRLAIDDSQGLLARLCFRDESCKLEYAQALQALALSFESLDLPAQARELGARIDHYGKPIELGSEREHEVSTAREKLEAFLRERPAEVRRQLTCLDAGGSELDRDGDGYGCTDCDDANAAVHPGATESCNFIDDDCSGLEDDAAECACEVAAINGADFHFCSLPMPWADADRHCAQKGLALARIDSKQVSKALYRKATRIDRQRWWIGYSDADSEGDFRWRDGTPGTFTYWSRRQPDNGSCNEDCAALRSKADGRWHDTHCNQHRPFICGPLSSPTARGAP